MDKLYEDFTTSFLPLVYDGLMITKEYFDDLFGRYVSFLIVLDSIKVVIATILIALGAYLFRIGVKRGLEIDDGIVIAMVVFGSILVVVFTIALMVSVENLIQDIYIPEVRIFEKLNRFN